MSKFVVGKSYIGTTGKLAWECLYVDNNGVLLRNEVGLTGWYHHSSVEGMRLYEAPIIHKRKIAVFRYGGKICFGCPITEPEKYHMNESLEDFIQWIDIQYEEKRAP